MLSHAFTIFRHSAGKSVRNTASKSIAIGWFCY